MEDAYLHPDLVTYLCQSHDMTPDRAAHLIDEVVNFFSESCTRFVQRRHHELKQSGLNNAAIYQQITQELIHHRFPAETLSERQIRRIVYG